MFLFGSLTSGLSTALLQWTGVIALVLVGIFAVIGIFDKANQGKKAQADKLDDRLINLLKQEVEALTRKFAEQSSLVSNIQAELQLVKRENEILRELAQGKDPVTAKFYANANESIERTKHLLELVEGQQAILNKLTDMAEAVWIPETGRRITDSQIAPAKRKVISRKNLQGEN